MTSFFQRLRERWGSGSGVRMDAAVEGAADAHAGPVAAAELAPVAAAVDARPTRKLNDREESLLVLAGHFQELTALLRASQARSDDQLDKLVAATQALASLPGSSQRQVELLTAFGGQLQSQHEQATQIAATLTSLPMLLNSVEASLTRAAATDERAAAAMQRFEATMERVSGAMQQMVKHSEQQATASKQLAERRETDFRELTAGLERAQHAAASELQRTTDENLTSLRRTHEDQSNRLQRIVNESTLWTRAALVGIGLVVLGIGGLLALVLFR